MSRNAAAAARELLARFRRQRPLRGGSLIITIFGDCIMPRGGAVSLGSLIALGAPFGLNERLVRTATARLAQEGWLEGRRGGKRSEYHLSKTGRQRFAEATKRIYSEPDHAWAGRWTLIVLPPAGGRERKALREELVWRGFGELSAGIFAHPGRDARFLALQRRPAGLQSKIMVFDARLSGDDTPQRLVSLGWDLDDLGRRYRRFVRRFGRVEAALRSRAHLDEQACFSIRTLLIHEYRRLHLRDPLLPARLLRAGWPGTRAAVLCRDIYAMVFAPSEIYLSRVAARLNGPLPAAGAQVLHRFGGIGTLSSTSGPA